MGFPWFLLLNMHDLTEMLRCYLNLGRAWISVVECSPNCISRRFGGLILSIE